jgi:hypothetical protein
MSRRRYEILLPIRYNDGSLVEPEKFFQAQEELVRAFGALTTSPELLRGVWVHEGQRFEDENLRMVIDVEATRENREILCGTQTEAKSDVPANRYLDCLIRNRSDLRNGS